MNLSPPLCAELLDLDAWGEILDTYGRTMRVAVALTDAQGLLLGDVHNVQPVWSLLHDAAPDRGAGCPLCVATPQPCTAVTEAVRTGVVVTVHDGVRLTHSAVPLLLGTQPLGAIVAGQVFDRYPDALALRRVARDFQVSAQALWAVARAQRPVSASLLRSSSDLLSALGGSFLRQRYGAIIEAKLAETNGRFRLLVEAVTDYALFTLDTGGRVTSWNSGAERMLGHSEAEFLGQNFSCVFMPEDIENRVPEAQLQKALHAGLSEDEGWRVGKGQRRFLAHVSVTPLLADAGSLSGFAVIMQDVTKARKDAIVVEAARQERTRLHNNFLSHVSHELRTPLTAIYFFTTNVLDGLLGELNHDQREQLTLAVNNVAQLTDMVTDLLDITLVETHRLTVEPQVVGSAKLITEVLSTCRTNAANKGITLQADVAPDLPCLWADPTRVRQILTNLIDNGIKFTPEHGALTIASRRFAEDDDYLCLSVSDTGCGISPENREIIFDRLAQVKDTTTASRSGLGLGLFISRELVTGHGGRIWVESEPGHGSAFYFTLPVFSLARMCADVISSPNLVAGCVTLMAVDVITNDPAQVSLLPEIRRVLKRCLRGTHDVLLPEMDHSGGAHTCFIVASTDPSGCEVISRRIETELKSVDTAGRLEPRFASTRLSVAPGQSREEQIDDVTTRIDRVIQWHLVEREKETVK